MHFFIHEKVNYLYIQRGTISKCLPKFIWEKEYIFIHYNTIGIEGRMWEAIRNATGGKSFVIVYKDRCVLQAGLASEVEGKAKTVNSSELMQGSLCQAVLNSGKRKEPIPTVLKFSLFWQIPISFCYFSIWPCIFIIFPSGLRFSLFQQVTVGLIYFAKWPEVFVV